MRGVTASPTMIPAPPVPEIKIVYPPWMDPIYILRTSRTVISADQTFPASLIVTVPSNPRRWAIGFAANAGIMGSAIRVSPHTDPSAFPWQVSQTSPLQPFVWYTLFEYGPFVCGQWFVTGNMGSTFRFFEVEHYGGEAHVGE